MKYISTNISFCLILLLTFLWSGCNGITNKEKQVQLARVGNEHLTLDEARKNIPDFLLKEDSLSAIRSYRQDWIRRKVILQEAERLGIRRNKVVQQKLAKARQEVLTEALKDYILGEVVDQLTISDEEARNYYQANKNKFILDERYVRFRHMETSSLEAARTARRALMAGTPWPEVARRYSIAPEAKINNSEQYWPVSMAVADLGIMNHYLKNSVIGITEISPIKRINGNYHFIQLMEAKAQGEHPDLEWLIEQIKEWLIIEKKRRHYNSYIQNLYLKAKSNNEIDSFNVLTTNSNSQKSISDTLETTQSNE